MVRPPLILLLGMHRSGTSLLGSILEALGLGLPGPLLAADQHNPKGYFERQDITALQDHLLQELGRTWTSASGALPLPPHWLDLPSTQRVRASLQALLREEATRQSDAWAIKDPRCSLLLPLWHQVCAELEIPLQLIASVRDPAEVMVSLLHRDAESTGMTPWRAQQLWWHHNRQLLLDATDLPLAVVNYGDWFTPAAAQNQLGASGPVLPPSDPASQSPQPSPADLARAGQAIQPQHRRSQRLRRQLPLPIQHQLNRFYQKLSQLARHPAPGGTAARRSLESWLQKPRQSALPAIAPDSGSLRGRLIRQRALLMPHLDPGAWFDPAHYRRQLPHLAAEHDPLCHYWWRGWRE